MTNAYLSLSICKRCKCMYDSFVREPELDGVAVFVEPKDCPQCGNSLDNFMTYKPLNS